MRFDRERFNASKAAAQRLIAHNEADPDIRDTLVSAIDRANALSLEDRIVRLLSKWDVPLSHLPDRAINGIVRARNAVLHRGSYYDDKPKTTPGLWHHVTVAREVFTRIVLQRIGFVDNYYTYVPEWRQINFPACTPV